MGEDHAYFCTARFSPDGPEVGLHIEISAMPNEVIDPVRFRDDRKHAAYDADSAQRFWRVLVQCDRVFKLFRTSFIGKSSPVHLFWGSFDLAVTRFSGRRAPIHPGGIPNLPDGGAVTMPPGWKEAYRNWAAAGWNGLSAPVEWGGQGAPLRPQRGADRALERRLDAIGLGPLLPFSVGSWGSSCCHTMW